LKNKKKLIEDLDLLNVKSAKKSLRHENNMKLNLKLVHFFYKFGVFDKRIASL